MLAPPGAAAARLRVSVAAPWSGRLWPARAGPGVMPRAATSRACSDPALRDARGAQQLDLKSVSRAWAAQAAPAGCAGRLRITTPSAPGCAQSSRVRAGNCFVTRRQSRSATRADLGAQQWGRKKAAAGGRRARAPPPPALAKTGADALAPHAPALAAALLAELPGRLWDGKEALLDALAALAAAAPAALAPPAGPGEAAVVAALTAAAERRKMAYVAAALRALETALAGLPGDHFGAVAPLLLGGVARSTAALGATPAPAADAQARRARRAAHPDTLNGCRTTAWA